MRSCFQHHLPNFTATMTNALSTVTRRWVLKSLCQHFKVMFSFWWPILGTYIYSLFSSWWTTLGTYLSVFFLVNNTGNLFLCILPSEQHWELISLFSSWYTILGTFLCFFPGVQHLDAIYFLLTNIVNKINFCLFSSRWPILGIHLLYKNIIVSRLEMQQWWFPWNYLIKQAPPIHVNNWKSGGPLLLYKLYVHLYNYTM